ncbi:MAG: hypothetical protein WAL56_00810 [Candidatus Sulfotelmatobacter sp.]
MRSLDLHSVDISTTRAGATPLPMNGVWRTIRSYILWQHERGTLHYDIMVTLILIFIFATPYWINYNDKPAPQNTHQTDVVVTPDAQGGLVYEISGSAITAGDDSAVREQFMHVIEPISGAVTIMRYEAVADWGGKVQTYRVWVKRK